MTQIVADIGGTPNTSSWIKSIVDSSHLITFFISIVVIVYGSFRSLNYEQDAKTNQKGESNVQTLSTAQVLFIPAAASISLLLMFFYFESIQTIFLICTAILATIAFTFLLLPLFKYLFKSVDRFRINCCFLGKICIAELFSVMTSLLIVSVWIITGHWLLMDVLGMGFCVTFIAIVRLPSLKVSTLLLAGLVVYDIFWVYFSQAIFSTNVMIKVATKDADNPFGDLAKRFNLRDSKDSVKVSLPGKLVVPSYYNKGNYSILGLGDIVMPGLLLCFVLRFDIYKRNQLNELLKSSSNSDSNNNINSSSANLLNSSIGPYRPIRLTYFHCSLIGYLVGLITATLSSEVFKSAQPALLYLVPFTLLPLIVMAYLRGDLKRMWSEPFTYTNSKYFIV